MSCTPRQVQEEDSKLHFNKILELIEKSSFQDEEWRVIADKCQEKINKSVAVSVNKFLQTLAAKEFVDEFTNDCTTHYRKKPKLNDGKGQENLLFEIESLIHDLNITSAQYKEELGEHKELCFTIECSYQNGIHTIRLEYVVEMVDFDYSRFRKVIFLLPNDDDEEWDDIEMLRDALKLKHISTSMLCCLWDQIFDSAFPKDWSYRWDATEEDGQA